MKRALIGNGGHAREVMAQMGEALIRFVDDEYYLEEDGVIPISKFDPTEFKVMVAVGDSLDRFNIIKRLPTETKYFTFIHSTALLLGNDIEIGEGSFIGAYSILTTNIKIGQHSILNRANHISHDCRIGDYFTASPGSKVSGNCTIGDCVYLGTNSSVKEKIQIAGFTKVGLNAGVVKSITEPGIYTGTPAKQIKWNQLRKE